MTTKILIDNLISELKKDYFSIEGEPEYPTTGIEFCDFLEEDYFEDIFLERPYSFLTSVISNSLDEQLRGVMYQDLATANSLSHLVIKTYSQNLCNCAGIDETDTDSFSKKMIEMVPLVTPSILCKDWSNAINISQYLIGSLNAENCIIGRGQFNAYIPWFMIKLLSKIFNIPLDRRKPFYPKEKEFSNYQNILDNWDTDDALEIENMVNLLCELHLHSNESEQINRYLDRELFTVFPLEIFIWLKLRDYKDLVTPQRFSHPIMNTSITQTLLRVDEILPRPLAQPDIKQFLEKLQKICTQTEVEIPEWV